MAEEPEKQNFCQCVEGMCVCTALLQWEDCKFAVEHTFMPRCRFRRAMSADLIHCDCQDAQDEARKK
jgi:hypothetical protein